MASIPFVILGIVLTVLAGVALSFQTGINATLGRVSGNKPFAAVISFSVGLTALIIYFLLDTYPRGKRAPEISKLKEVPSWAWVGGLLGAYYVAVTIIFAPSLGAGTITAVFVTAQLITSIVLDYFGLVGFEKRSLQWERLVGAFLMIAGVIMISVFDGSPRDVKAPVHSVQATPSGHFAGNPTTTNGIGHCLDGESC